MSDNGATLDRLESSLGSDWRAIRKARSDATAKRNRLDELFRGQNSPDTSLIVFGSVARQEVTSSSDLDWILLIDGQSVPEHKEQERVIESILAENKFIEPGKSGVFGKMVSSHDLVHNIGGEDDLNSNTTRRVLMLLESLPIGTVKRSIALGGNSFADISKTIVEFGTAAEMCASPAFSSTISPDTGVL